MTDLETGELDRALYDLGPAPPFDRFCETAVPSFERFVAGRSYIPWVARALDDLAIDPTSKAGVGGKPYHLWSSMHGRLALVSVRSKKEGNPETLTGHAFHRLMKLVSGTLRASRWRHPVRVDPSVMDRRARLALVADEWLEPGAPIGLEAGQDVIEVQLGAGRRRRLDSADSQHAMVRPVVAGADRGGGRRATVGRTGTRPDARRRHRRSRARVRTC